MSDEVKCDEERSNRCFTPEEVAAFKTTFENGKTLRKGMINAVAVILVGGLLAVFVLGLALTVRAVSQSTPEQLIKRTTGLPATDPMGPKGE